jgi:hypothetical protein
MTLLQAVNELLSGLGEPPVTVLDTGGTSEVSEAEEYIGIAMREIVLEDWPQTADESRTVPLPTFRLTVTGSGVFTWGETCTVGGVEVVFSHVETVGATTYMYVSGSTTPGTGTITGGTSGATRTVTAVLAITSSKIGIGSDWTSIRASPTEYRRITVRDGFLFDLDDLTTTFTGDVILDIRRDGSFTALTPALRQYVTKRAAVLFQQFKKRGITDDQFLVRRLNEARSVALRERQDHRRTNIHKTAEANAMSGNRLWVSIQ